MLAKVDKGFEASARMSNDHSYSCQQQPLTAENSNPNGCRTSTPCLVHPLLYSSELQHVLQLLQNMAFRTYRLRTNAPLLL